MTLHPGSRLGPYEIVSALGAGGMGEVYRARDPRLDRSVAIKILAPTVAADPAARDRFEREARAVAALDHPHICGIFDIGESEGLHYLVMPLLEGQTLATRVEKGALTLDQVLRFAVEIADALDKAHRHGIVHRDLKPANVMLTKMGAKLLDFGLAKLRTTSGPISMSGMTQLVTTTPETGQGTILGTLQYMSPEQVEGREADARSDIWALGTVIYEMATGRRAFQGATPASIIGAILKDEAPRVSSRQPLVPAALDQVIDGCLAKDPDERWQSAADVRRHLQLIQPSPSGERAQLTAAAPTRWSLLAIAVPILFAAGIGAWAAWMARPATPSIASPIGRPVVFTVEPPPGLTLAGRTASTSVPQLAVSPDGRFLVFAVTSDRGESTLWLRALDALEARPLAGSEGATDPFWSPDSRRVGFISNGSLKVIDLAVDAAAASLLRTRL